jgi:hypothetical protein
MTGISLHMQWPLTSQSHGSFSQKEQLVRKTALKTSPEATDCHEPVGQGVDAVQGWVSTLKPEQGDEFTTVQARDRVCQTTN